MIEQGEFVLEYERVLSVFVKRRVGVGYLATGDVRFVRHSNVWSVCEAV